MKKVNNSIATKLCTNLLDTRKIFWIIFSARHNSMTKFCCALFKYKNEKIGWDNWLTTLYFNQMRWHVEKGNILGCTPSWVVWVRLSESRLLEVDLSWSRIGNSFYFTWKWKLWDYPINYLGHSGDFEFVVW